MSNLDDVQYRLVCCIETATRNDGNCLYNAPYGVVPDTQKYGKGYCKIISFGISRFLDGVVKIISPTHIEVGGSGPLGFRVRGVYYSVEDVEEALLNIFEI